MTAVYVLLALGLALGGVIALAVKAFAVKTDPRIEQVEELLPGANCGACAFAGCADFARALTTGEAAPEECPVSDPEAASLIANVLGIEAGTRLAKVAVVRCGGDNESTSKVRYNGVSDCRSANLVAGGAKGCLYGCLGLGSCARACPFGAIEMREGLALVHSDICTGCGKCVSACPRNLIVLVPREVPIQVFCNSPEKGAAKKKVCSVCCIGCRKCVKTAPEGTMTMEGMLARVNHEAPPENADICEVCPTGCLRPLDPRDWNEGMPPQTDAAPNSKQPQEVAANA
mgnify:CR=1 FL=1